MTLRLAVLSGAVIISSCINAEAQLVRFEPPLAGACSVVVQFPESNPKIRSLTVKGYAVKLSKRSRIDDFRVRIPLLSPLKEGDEIDGNVRTAKNEYAIEKVPVGLGVRGDIGCPDIPGEVKPPDDRNVFELNPFIGLAIDNFAPKSINGYPDSSATTGIRRTFGVIGQYRLLGDPGDDHQIWLTGATLNGVRTADIDCSDPEQAVLCKGGQPDTSLGNTTNAGKIGIQVLEHASTLEAHAGVRYEFGTLQRNSSMPAKPFVFSRFGFVDVINPVTRCVATAGSSCAAAAQAAGQPVNGVVGISGAQAGALSEYYGGIGLLLPSGAFRNSAVTYGLAHEDIFGSSRGGLKRRKLNAVAFVDIGSQLANTSVGKAIGMGGWRGFIALDVDRSARRYGADAIETYVGIEFDLGKIFQ